jgi:hypothetical protein
MFSKWLIVLFLILNFQGFSQSDLQVSFGTSSWRFAHQFNDLSSPFQLSYWGGLNYERVIQNSSVALFTGINYRYSPPGTAIVDLTDEENLLAVIYEKEINENFVEVVHHEIAVPLQMVFYHNGFRTAFGAEYKRYWFPYSTSSIVEKGYNDIGLRVLTGARFSKRISFSIGYYYGLRNVIELRAIPNNGSAGAVFSSKVQQLDVQFNISLFKGMDGERYYLSYKP